jgi:hypothetical protein
MEADLLHRSLDELAAQDLSTLCDAEIHELTMGLARAKCRVEGVLMAALDVWDARQIWSDDGSKSPAARLAREANWSKAAASTAIRRARALRRLPVTAAAVTAGTMGAEFVDLVDHASKVELTVPFSVCEPAIVDGCIRTGYAESKDAINRWVDAADPESAEERARKRFERRGLSAAGTIDGLVHLNGLATGRVRTAGQRRADARVEIARRSAALDTAETAAGKPARIVLSVVIGLNTFEHLCELADGTPMTPGDLVPHLHRTDIERIVFDTPDRVMSISHRRAFPAAVRRAVELRDRRCAHPSGCDDPADWCDIDHVEEHSRGGETSEANARALCRTHNRNHALRNRAPASGAPRTTRPPRGWIPHTPNLGPSAHTGDRTSGDTDGDPDGDH